MPAHPDPPEDWVILNTRISRAIGSKLNELVADTSGPRRTKRQIVEEAIDHLYASHRRRRRPTGGRDVT